MNHELLLYILQDSKYIFAISDIYAEISGVKLDD